jgi:hypothetical protein
MSAVRPPVRVLATALLVLGIGGPALAQNPGVTVQVNVGANRHPISPLIYGTA